MTIKIVKLEPDALAPVYAHAGDAGLDFYAYEGLFLKPMERVAVRTGIKMEIPDGYVGLVWDKSGRALHDGLHTLAGVVDATYRGEIRIVVTNLTEEPIEIKKGTKLAQMLIQRVEHALLEEVREVSDTKRGEGAFGSTEYSGA